MHNSLTPKTPSRWNLPWCGEGAYLTRRFQPSASKRRARCSDAASFNKDKQIFFMPMPRTCSLKLKNLDQSSLLIFSIFSLLVGFSLGPTYILYPYISSFRGADYIKSFSLQFKAVWSFRLWRWNMTFSKTEMKELGRSPKQYSQQKIIDPNISSMPQTSCSRKKPAGERV